MAAPTEGCEATSTPHLTRDGRNAGVRAHAFELGCVGIDGNDLMPALLETAKNGVGGSATRA